MTYVYITNLAQVLRDAGLPVREYPGWKTRGRPSASGGFGPVGVLCHHTATTKKWLLSTTIRLLLNGRSDLPGPLAQVGLDRKGVWHVLAAGRANHAGTAKASGSVAAGDGNYLYVGVEAFNDGRGEPWPEVQYNSYVRGVAAISKHVTKNSARTVRGHKETSVTGKIDPTFNMDTFRSRVSKEMAVKPNLPVPLPARDRAANRIDDAAKKAPVPAVRNLMKRAAEELRKGHIKPSKAGRKRAAQVNEGR